MSKGRYGIHGGQYIPETLMNEVTKLEREYEFYKNNASFKRFWSSSVLVIKSTAPILRR